MRRKGTAAMNFKTTTHTVKATGDGPERRFINFNGALAGDDDAVLGVSQTAFKTGSVFAADIIGVTEVEAGGVIAKGDKITPDATGRAIKAPDNATNVVGRAVNDVATVGAGALVLIR